MVMAYEKIDNIEYSIIYNQHELILYFRRGFFRPPEKAGTFKVMATNNSGMTSLATVTVENTTPIRANINPLKITLAPKEQWTFQPVVTGFITSVRLDV